MFSQQHNTCLPLLQFLEGEFSRSKFNLRNWRCIYVQHILGSNIACSEFLCKLGLEKSNLYIIGKAYSTSKTALDTYVSRNFNVANLGENYNHEAAFDDQLIEYSRSTIGTLQGCSSENILLIDEGGILARAVEQLEGPMWDALKLVELTSRGVKHFEKISSKLSVVDVARSRVKKNVEPPLIAASMIECLMRNPSIATQTPRARFGIVGYGAIGKAIYDHLTLAGFNAVAYDERERAPGPSSLGELVENSDFILSSTGKGIDLVGQILNFRGNKIFVNCGSSDVEFNLWKIRGMNEIEWLNSDEVNSNLVIGDLELRTEKGCFCFLRGGFPINFDGSFDPIPSGKIQITRSILMAGALIVTRENAPGVHPLPEEIQERIEAKYFELLDVLD